MKKSRIGLIIILWILFIACAGAICYLSFQNGEDARALGRDFMYSFAEYHYKTTDIPSEVMDDFIYKVRQTGRLLIFFLLGILGTSAVHFTLRRLNWFFRMLISVLMLLMVAVLTERLKIYLPTRHYSVSEMYISIAGAMLGFLFISVCTMAFSFIRFVIRQVHRFT